MVLQGQSIINGAVVIVRYFGGTKLGTGGLVRAYSESVNIVIENLEFIEYKKELFAAIEIEYSNVRLIEHECNSFNVSIIEKVFDIKIVYRIKSDESNMKNFLEKVSRVVKTL